MRVLYRGWPWGRCQTSSLSRDKAALRKLAAAILFSAKVVGGKSNRHGFQGK